MAIGGAQHYPSSWHIRCMWENSFALLLGMCVGDRFIVVPPDKKIALLLFSGLFFALAPCLDVVAMLDFDPKEKFTLPLLMALSHFLWSIFSLGFLLFRGKVTFASGPSDLVVAGPYSYTRNPMVLAVLVHYLASHLLNCGLTKLAVPVYLFLAFIIMTLWFKFIEEPDLKKRFGWRYDEYCENVPRWIPRSTPYHLPNAEKNPNEAAQD